MASHGFYVWLLNSAIVLQIVKTPAWLRVLQISIGVISIILSGYVLLYPGITVLVAVQILSIVLLIVGIERIAIGIFSPYHRKSSSRFSNIGLGALAIAFSILIMAFPIFSTSIDILRRICSIVQWHSKNHTWCWRPRYYKVV